MASVNRTAFCVTRISSACDTEQQFHWLGRMFAVLFGALGITSFLRNSISKSSSLLRVVASHLFRECHTPVVVVGVG